MSTATETPAATLADRIKAYRKTHALSCGQFADLLQSGISRRTVEHWEQGRNPHPLIVVALENLLTTPRKAPVKKA